MAALSDRSRLPCALATSVALASALALGATTAARTEALTPREQALHALNRLGFGPRPGDVERVERMGVPAYVELQLHPERIADTRVEARVAALPTLGLSSAELYARFEAPVREARKRLKAEKADAAPDGAGGDDERRRLGAMIPPENRPRRILEDLTAARVVRAAESERQLNEVLVDFWMNHFNVYANKGLDRILVAAFERDTIRPRVFGRFEDLLLATAQSPAMLFYLDNARSVADEEHRPAVFARAGRFGRATSAAGKAPKGLNENYARELMELHTLGVDGGYTQKDVTELARVLTGWSIAGPARKRPRPLRLPRAPARRRAEGRPWRSGLHREAAWTRANRRIRMLARRPETARHVAFQLCQRLVADAPPPALVARVAERFLATRGDLRETVRAIVTSPEFFAPEYYRAKVKSPFEYAVSAIRAVGATTTGGRSPNRSRRWASPCTSVSRRRGTPTPPRPGSTRARCWRA